MRDRKHELGHEKMGSLLLRYSSPAIVAMIVNSLYNLVDAIFVGQGVGPLGLAGLAVAFPIQIVILGVAQVVGYGSASIISRSLGAGDARKADRMAGTSFVTVAVFGLVMTVGGLSFLEPLVRLFGATEAVLPFAADYLGIILLGSCFFVVSVSCSNLARSEGNVKVAMISMIIGAGLNTILDPILIFGLKMGIRGAAVATVFAQFCSFCFLCAYFLSGKSMLHITRRDLKPDLRLLPEMFAIGSASFARVASGSLFALVLNNSVTHYGTDIHLAIVGAMNRIVTFSFMPLFGLVQGLQPIVGFNYGARNLPRVKEALHKAIQVATAFSVLGFLLLMLFPRTILGLFGKDPELLGQGVTILRVAILLLPIAGFRIMADGFFQAIGHAKPALFLSFARPVLIHIPLVLLLPLYFGLSGLWISYPVTDFLSTALSAAWLLAVTRRFSTQ